MYLHHAVGALTACEQRCPSFVSDDGETGDGFGDGADPQDDARSDGDASSSCATGGRGPINGVRIQDRVVEFVRRRLGTNLRLALDGKNQHYPLEPVLVEAKERIALYVTTRQLRRWVRFSEVVGETQARATARVNNSYRTRQVHKPSFFTHGKVGGGRRTVPSVDTGYTPGIFSR